MNTQPLPILYSFRRCPYAMRARLALCLAGIPYTCREINLKDKHPQFLSTSPKGTVPVLVLSDGEVIAESLEILDYVAQYAPQLSISSNMITTYTDLLSQLNHLFIPALNRYKYQDRYPESDKSHLLNKMKEFCIKLEELLKQHGYLCSNNPTIADIAIVPLIRQLHRCDSQILATFNIPLLVQWLRSITETPSFHHIMQKQNYWQPDHTPIIMRYDTQEQTPDN